ncbi:MAG: preprotein translocase subunit SecY [Clostridia bacterium]|nr:preprotein translocase subunit SecY [Clostridia bacterium]
MFKTLVNAWRIPDIRKKLLFTIFVLFLYRVGNAVPIPFIDPVAVKAMFTFQGENAFYGYLNMLTGGSFTAATIFALSIFPYITSSIIIQLLVMAIPALERKVKEGGEAGRKFQEKMVRYGAIVLGIVQGFIYYLNLARSTLTDGTSIIINNGFFTAFMIVMTFAAGTALITWLGEMITNKGIGNGISMILFAGIISRLPADLTTGIAGIRAGTLPIWLAVIIVLGTIALVGFVVWVSQAERRIPVQYAKRVVGRKVYGGQSTFIPMKVNMTGVMPIIFASSIVSLPAIIASFFQAPTAGFWYHFLRLTQPPSIVYMVLYILLIVAFSFFYAYTQVNPFEMANNMKNNGGFVPGLRPGRSTAEHISKIMKHVTVLGAIFLSFVAILPVIVSAFDANLSNLALGGTSLLIVVGVAIETVQQLESQMMLRHYKGFLE